MTIFAASDLHLQNHRRVWWSWKMVYIDALTMAAMGGHFFVARITFAIPESVVCGSIVILATLHSRAGAILRPTLSGHVKVHVLGAQAGLIEGERRGTVILDDHKLLILMQRNQIHQS
jgi:hypothetical protein